MYDPVSGGSAVRSEDGMSITPSYVALRREQEEGLHDAMMRSPRRVAQLEGENRTATGAGGNDSEE